MIDTLLDIPVHVRGRLASALESGLLEPPGSAMAVRATIGAGYEEAILHVLREWERLGVSAAAGAAWLKSLRLAASRTPAPDFVWTGPAVAGLHARDTRRVYEELLGSANRSIWASTYVFSDGPRAFRTLAERMDAVPGLDVTLLLNIERRRGDTTAADSLVRRFADEFWGGEWPGAARPKVYYDPRSVEPGSPGWRAPRQGGGGGRGIGVHHIGKLYRGGTGPQHRAWARRARPGTGYDGDQPLSRADREKPAGAFAGCVASGRG